MMVQLLVGECLLLTVLKVSGSNVIIILDMYVFKLPYEFWLQHLRMSILKISCLSGLAEVGRVTRALTGPLIVKTSHFVH